MFADRRGCSPGEGACDRVKAPSRRSVSQPDPRGRNSREMHLEPQSLSCYAHNLAGVGLGRHLSRSSARVPVLGWVEERIRPRRCALPFLKPRARVRGGSREDATVGGCMLHVEIDYLRNKHLGKT